MKVFVFQDAQAASERIAEEIAKMIEEKPESSIALPSGSTQLNLYSLLAKLNSAGKIDFSKTIFFNLDEYIGLSQSHEQSFAFFLEKNFLEKTNAKKENIFLFDGAAGDISKEILEKEAKIKKFGLDLAWLGIGENAHIAFNEPNSNFSSKTRVVNLAQTTINVNSRFFNSKKEVPKKAVTMGVGSILSAKKIIQLAFGEKKAPAVKKAFGSEPSEQAPASALQLHSNAAVYCDLQAASLLDKTGKKVELIFS